MKLEILVLSVIALIFILQFIIRKIYYYIRDERIERFKRKYCHDELVESHFGCSSSDWYNSMGIKFDGRE